MAKAKEPTTVTIFGVEYAITSDREPEEVRRIAKFVDDKMWEISESNNLISTEKVAILAALNIAEEYLRTLEQRKRDADRVARKETNLIKLIDESRL